MQSWQSEFTNGKMKEIVSEYDISEMTKERRRRRRERAIRGKAWKKIDCERKKEGKKVVD